MKTEAINACVTFGDFIRKTRVQNNITARSASESIEWLPSNFSKLEHGALHPPSDAAKQRALAVAIGITSGSDQEAEFFDLAGKANNAVPADLAEIISEDEALPLLLRTIGNKRLNKTEIARLVAIVRETDGNSKKIQQRA